MDYLKNLNDSIFGRIAHVNELYNFSDMVFQNRPFTVYLSRLRNLHPYYVNP